MNDIWLDVARVVVEPDRDGLFDGGADHVQVPPRQHRPLHWHLFRQTPALHRPRTALRRRSQDIPARVQA